MASSVINATQASGAYQRWEFESFDRPAAAEETPASLSTGGGEQAGADALQTDVTPFDSTFEIAPGITLPTADDIERVHQDAMKEGYNAGYEEGSARGRLEAAELHQLLGGLDESLSALDQEVAAELLALALEVARKVIRDTLTANPDVIMGVIRDALTELPQQHATIRLHPEDARLARAYVGEHFDSVAHRIIEDDSILRGGCLVESAGTQIDSQVGTRWRRVVESLSRDATRFETPDEGTTNPERNGGRNGAPAASEAKPAQSSTPSPASIKPAAPEPVASSETQAETSPDSDRSAQGTDTGGTPEAEAEADTETIEALAGASSAAAHSDFDVDTQAEASTDISTENTPDNDDNETPTEEAQP